MGLPVERVPWPKLQTGVHRSVVGVKGRTSVEGRGGTPAAVYIVTSFPGLVVEGDRSWLDAVCCEAEVVCDSLFCCRGALAIEKPTSVGWIIVFAKGVSVVAALGGLCEWRSWRGAKTPWGSCFQAVVEQE